MEKVTTEDNMFEVTGSETSEKNGLYNAHKQPSRHAGQ